MFSPSQIARYRTGSEYVVRQITEPNVEIKDKVDVQKLTAVNLYVTNSNDNTVSVISGQTNTVIGNPIPVGLNPDGIASDLTNGNIYVANGGNTNAPGNIGNTVSVISGTTNQVIASITVDKIPVGIAFDSATHNIYVAMKVHQTTPETPHL